MADTDITIATHRQEDRIIIQGDTPTFQFTLTDGDGVAVDLTTISSMLFSAKLSPNQPNAEAQFSVTATVSGDPTLGIVVATLAVADTDTAGNYIAELELTFPGPVINTAQRFKLKIEPEIII